MHRLQLLLASFLVMMVAAAAKAAPEWGLAAHHERKLFADVLLGDERGQYWDQRLPQGWVWLKDHKPPGDDYFRLDQVEPKERDGRIVFVISKWNFFGINRQHWSFEKLAAKSREIDASKDVEFRESDECKALLRTFAEFDAAGAAKALERTAEKPTVKHAEMGLLVVKAKSGKVAAVLFERFGASALVRVSALPEAADAALPAERREAFDTDARWSADLDGDSTADIEWVPRTETEDAHLRAAAGAVVSSAGSAK